MSSKETFEKTGSYSKQIPDHIGERVFTSLDNKYPESITVGGEAFEFRHENPDQGNAVYTKRIKTDQPVIMENIVVDSTGTIIDHLLYDQRDEETKIKNAKP